MKKEISEISFVSFRKEKEVPHCSSLVEYVFTNISCSYIILTKLSLILEVESPTYKKFTYSVVHRAALNVDRFIVYLLQYGDSIALSN